MKIWKRILLFFICAGVLGCVAVVELSNYIKNETAARILSVEEAAEEGADCILVLGCGVRPDGTPSLMLTDRVETGIALYQAGAAEKLLMSGDHGTEDYDEVNTMKNIAKENGVPSADIFMDHAGFSTYDSVYRTKEIFCAKKVIIVSQKYHLPRALYIAEKLGLDAYGVAAADIHYRGQSYREVREMLARAKDFFSVAWKRKPTLLGETIPISGNGDCTNDVKASESKFGFVQEDEK